MRSPLPMAARKRATAAAMSPPRPRRSPASSALNALAGTELNLDSPTWTCSPVLVSRYDRSLPTSRLRNPTHVRRSRYTRDGSGSVISSCPLGPRDPSFSNLNQLLRSAE